MTDLAALIRAVEAEHTDDEIRAMAEGWRQRTADAKAARRAARLDAWQARHERIWKRWRMWPDDSPTGPSLTGWRQFARWLDALPDLSGLDPDDAWYRFVDAHDDRCAICRHGDRPLVVDHDHRTGHVRGLLCAVCNSSERSTDGRIFLRYRAWPPASACGLRRMHDAGADRLVPVVVDSAGVIDADLDRHDLPPFPMHIPVRLSDLPA